MSRAPRSCLGLPGHGEVAVERYALGQMDTAESEAFEGHCLSCPACADEVMGLIDDTGLVRARLPSPSS